MARPSARPAAWLLVVASMLGPASLNADGPTAAVAAAAKRGDAASVGKLLAHGADVDATQGDGLTGLHWAAQRGDAGLVAVLLRAGAHVRVATRLGEYTPLHLAAEIGSAPVIALLVRAGADVDAVTAAGTTPLMLAAASGDTASLAALLEGGAAVNARESPRGHTALMFAAAADRVAAVRLLLEKGADPNLATHTADLTRAVTEPARLAVPLNAPRPEPAAPGTAAVASRTRVAGVDRQYSFNELVYAQGGMTPLLFAARQGYDRVVTALLDTGVDVNQRKDGDRITPLLIATINGRFDLGALLLERGADPNLAGENGVTPLYAAINVQWAPKTLYPQPRAYLNQAVGYLEFMTLLLDYGADPNARLRKKVWYSGYNFDQSGVDEIGATPFWRAAYASDIDAMKMLVARGADPCVPTIKPAGRPQVGDGELRGAKDESGLPPIPLGGPSVTPLQAAAGAGFGEGFAANAHRAAPSGMLAAVKYLVEELHADVNASDHEGNTAMHHAAARGDNEMILYLIARGGDVKAVNREGMTTVDMANGPVQRVEPFPATIALLEKLGARNSHRCISC